MTRYRFAIDHELILTVDGQDCSLNEKGIYKGNINQSVKDAFIQHGIIEEVKEPRVLKDKLSLEDVGSSGLVCLGIPEGTWNIEYIATEVL